MTRRWLTGLALLLVAPAPAALAQTAPPRDTVRLTVHGAVARAQELSEEVRIAREQVALADAQATQVRAAALPQVSGLLRYERTLRSIFDIAAPPAEEPLPGDEPGLDLDALFGDLPFGRPNTWIVSLQINQALYAGGRLRAATEIARRGRSVAELQLLEAEAQVARRVRDAYFQAVFTESLTEIAEEAFALANEQLSLVEVRQRQGTASEFELLQAQVERDNLEPQIVEARNARVLATLELKRLINLPAGHDLELVLTLDPAAAAATQIDREAVLEAARSRPSLRAAREQVRIQEGTVRLARAERLPTVSAFGAFAYHAFPEGIFPRGIPGGSQWRPDWAIGVQVSIPIFDGFRTRGAIAEARATVRVAQLQQAQADEGVELEVAAGFAQFDAARAQIEARRATSAQAARGLELAELRYGTGMATLIEVSNARLLLQRARVNEAEALFSFLSSLVALEHASGGQLGLVDQLLERKQP